MPVVEDKGIEAKMSAMREILMYEISANSTHSSSEKMVLAKKLATLYSNLAFDFHEVIQRRVAINASHAS